MSSYNIDGLDVLLSYRLPEVLDLCPRVFEKRNIEKQVHFVTLLFERIRQGIDGPEACQQTLRCLRTRLHRLPLETTEQLLELMYLPNIALPIIHEMPRLVHGCQPSTISLVFEHFTSFLETDRSLLVPVLGALTQIKLSTELQSKAVKIAMDALPVVQEDDFPTIVKSLISMVNKSTCSRIIQALRRESTKISTDTLYIVVGILNNLLLSNQLVQETFLKACGRTRVVSVFDLLLLLFLLNQPYDTEPAAKTFVRIVRNSALTLEILQQTCDLLKSASWSKLLVPFMKLCYALPGVILQIATVPAEMGELLLTWTSEIARLVLISHPPMRQEAAILLLELSIHSENYRDLSSIRHPEMITRARLTAATTLARLSHQEPQILQPYGHIVLETVLMESGHVDNRHLRLYLVDLLASAVVCIANIDSGFYSLMMILIQKHLLCAPSMQQIHTQSQEHRRETYSQSSSVIVAMHIILNSTNDPSDRDRLFGWVLRILPLASDEIAGAIYRLLRVCITPNSHWMDGIDDYLVCDAILSDPFEVECQELVERYDFFSSRPVDESSMMIIQQSQDSLYFLSERWKCYLALKDPSGCPAFVLSDDYHLFAEQSLSIQELSEREPSQVLRLIWSLVIAAELCILTINWFYPSKSADDLALIVDDVITWRFHARIICCTLKESNGMGNSRPGKWIDAQFQALEHFLTAKGGTMDSTIQLLPDLDLKLALALLSVESDDGSINILRREASLQRIRLELTHQAGIVSLDLSAETYHDQFSQAFDTIDTWNALKDHQFLVYLIKSSSNDSTRNADSRFLALIYHFILLLMSKYKDQCSELLTSLARGTGAVDLHNPRDVLYEWFLGQWHRTQDAVLSCLLCTILIRLSVGTEKQYHVGRICAAGIERLYPEHAQATYPDASILKLAFSYSFLLQGADSKSLIERFESVGYYKSIEARLIRYCLATSILLARPSQSVVFLLYLTQALQDVLRSCRRSSARATQGEHAELKALNVRTWLFVWDATFRMCLSLLMQLPPCDTTPSLNQVETLLGPYKSIGRVIFALYRLIQLICHMYQNELMKCPNAMATGIRKSCMELCSTLKHVLTTCLHWRTSPEAVGDLGHVNYFSQLVIEMDNLVMFLQKKQSVLTQERSERFTSSFFQQLKHAATLKCKIETFRTYLDEIRTSHQISSTLETKRDAFDWHVPLKAYQLVGKNLTSNEGWSPISDDPITMDPVEWEDESSESEDELTFEAKSKTKGLLQENEDLGFSTLVVEGRSKKS